MSGWAELPQVAPVLSLERFLGDPQDPDRPISFSRVVAWDEAGRFPEPGADALAAWGFPVRLVPERFGGELGSLESLGHLLRAVARRDLTLAVGYGMTAVVAAAPVWVVGEEAQQRAQADLVAAGCRMATAFSERGNGNDLLASRFRADECDGGEWSLHGEKWLINNFQSAAAVTLLARTDPAGGPRSLSLFLVHDHDLEGQEVEYLPRVRTLGLRGTELGGFRTEGVRLPADRRVGDRGVALEAALKAYQVTGTLIPALALGGTDTALRATADFARTRRLYGGTVLDIPHARSTLAGAFLDLLVADCVLLSGLRSLHVVPDQGSVWSRATQAFGVAAAERALRELAAVLGARHYLREEHWSGIFQKIVRDLPFFEVTHAGTWISLDRVARQMRFLLPPGGAGGESRVREIFDLETPLPELAPGRLELTSRGRNDALDGLATTLDRLPDGSGADAGTRERIAEHGASLRAEIEELSQGIRRLVSDGETPQSSVAWFDSARRYCELHAAACCLHTWVYSRHLLGDFFASGEWLDLALDRLLRGRWPPVGRARSRCDAVAEEVARRAWDGTAFAALPLRLAGGSSG